MCCEIVFRHTITARTMARQPPSPLALEKLPLHLSSNEPNSNNIERMHQATSWPSLSTTRASSQLSSPFGRLPRELRDLIYHFLFLQTPYLIQRFSSYDSTAVVPPVEKILPPLANYHAANILYLRYRHRSNAQGPNRQDFATPSKCPNWLQT